jgi:hypothetical protein
MKSENRVKSLVLILAVVLVMAVAGPAAAADFAATITITGDTEIQVGESTTLTATWMTNKDVTRYEWSVDGVGQGVVTMTGAQSGAPTFPFDGTAPGNYVISFRIWHHVQYVPSNGNNWIGWDATASVTITVTAAAAYEGLSHGYWKNHTEDWTVYSPSATLESVFDIPDTLGLDSYTLDQALDFTGGNTVEEKAQILLRNAVASLLNAAHPNIDYPLSLAEVIAEVNAALASENAATMLELEAILNEYNNLGADLSS